MSSGNIIAEETLPEDWKRNTLTRDLGLCEGGVDISSLFDKRCPKCGATDNDFCKFAGLFDVEK